MADLALESTDDLLSEIARRYDIGAFAGMQIEGHSSVSGLAHLGGAAAGVAMWAACRKRA